MTPANHILCVYLPRWSITRWYRRHPEYCTAAVAVIQSTGPRRVVVQVSPAAESNGIRPGLTAAEARALCPGLECLDEDVVGDQRALTALGKWFGRFTPVVSIGWDETDDAMDDTTAPPAALFLDLTGCERLFGGLAPLVERVRRSIARFDIPARLAVAPTAGAAWAFALTNCEDRPRAVDSALLLSSASDLPVETLRLDDSTIDGLRKLGIRRVGEVLALPREQLPARFGALLLRRIDQLIGTLDEPLTRLVNDPPVTAKLVFDAPIEALEDIWRIFEKLLGAVVADLARRNHGARQLRMTLTPDRGWGLPTVTRTITLSKPHRDRAAIMGLIKCETETIDCEHGFVRFQLDAPLHEPTAETQTQLFDPHAAEEEAELDRLLERLRVRLGESSVIRPRLIESHLPERRWEPNTDSETRRPQPIRNRRKPIRSSTFDVRRSAFDLIPNRDEHRTSNSQPRPMTLFPKPREVLVMCEPSDDRTGEPRQFSHSGSVHRLTRVVGPERIAGEWWRGHHRTRDYFDVEDHLGQRFWLFRVLRTVGELISVRWFLHGRFS